MLVSAKVVPTQRRRLHQCIPVNRCSAASKARLICCNRSSASLRISGPKAARRLGSNSSIFCRYARLTSSREASGATPSTSAHSGRNCGGVGGSPVENLSVIIPIRYQITMKPMKPASTVTRTSLLTILVEPHLRNRKLMELEVGLDAMLQGLIAADKLQRIGHDAAVEQAFVQVGHEHRTNNEFKCQRQQRLARELELPLRGYDVC